MKYVNGMRIIKQVLESFVEYEQIPKGSEQFIERLLQDLHYDSRKVRVQTLEHFKEYYTHLFEEKVTE